MANCVSFYGMEHDDIYRTLLRTSQRAYTANSEMTAFKSFPSDIQRQPIAPRDCRCSDAFRDDKALKSTHHDELQDAIRSAGEIAHWRDTYQNTDIGAEFMNQFGCYCIIGDERPFFVRCNTTVYGLSARSL